MKRVKIGKFSYFKQILSKRFQELRIAAKGKEEMCLQCNNRLEPGSIAWIKTEKPNRLLCKGWVCDKCFTEEINL